METLRQAWKQGVTEYALLLLLLLFVPDPFRGMGAWQNIMEPKKPGNSPGYGPEVIKRQRVTKE